MLKQLTKIYFGGGGLRWDNVGVTFPVVAFARNVEIKVPTLLWELPAGEPFSTLLNKGLKRLTSNKQHS